MKFSANLKALREEAAAAAEVVDARATIPALSYVRLTAEGSFLTLRSTDLQASLCSTLPIESEMDTDAAVRADVLYAALSKLEGVDVEIESEPRSVALSCGGARFEIPVFPGGVDDLPAFPVVAADSIGRIDGAVLSRMLRGASYGVHRGGKGYEHTAKCINLMFQPGTACARMAYDPRAALVVNAVAEIVGELEFNLPYDMVGRLSGWTGETEILGTAADLCFRSATRDLHARAVEFRVANIESVIKKCDSGEAGSVECSAFKGALSRGMIVHGSGTENPDVFLVLSDDSLSVSTHSDIRGKFSQQIPCEWQHEERRIRMDGSFLTDALAVIGTERMALTTFAQQTAYGLILRPVDGPDDELTLVAAGKAA